MKKQFFIYLGLLGLSFQLHAMESKQKIELHCYKKLSSVEPFLKFSTNIFGGKLVLIPDAKGKINIEEYVDIGERDIIRYQPFEELINEQHKEGLPYVIAVITEMGNQRYHDAGSFNQVILDSNNFSRIPGKTHPLTRKSIDYPIHYYAINSIDDEAFSYLCSEDELNKNDDRGYFLRIFMKANKGNKGAQNNLGVLYEEQGKFEQAEKYYKLAADNGDAIAQSNLGVLYEEQDKFEQAEKYYKLAADNGDAIAQSNLGILYEKQGKFEQAEKYYKFAADNGNMDAQNNLGVLYEKQGKFEQAKKHCNLAADNGHAIAQNNLGYVYECSKQFDNAIMWYRKAANSSDVIASLNLIYLFDEQAPEKISQAEVIHYWSVILPDNNKIKGYIAQYPDRWEKIQKIIEAIQSKK